MVARDILLAELTGVRYHVAHLSTRYAAAMVGFAKKRGLPVSCEVTPHHFALCDEEVKPYDANYKMKPPIRSCADRDAMIDAIVDDRVDALATDHAPHPGSEKMQEFERCPFGILGLETAIGLTFEHLVHPGRMSLQKLVELYTIGPARVLGLERGTLQPGAVADVTVFSSSVHWKYDVNQSFSRSRNSPFDGSAFRGGPVATIVGGRMIWKRDGGF
jgi:dihydroorotase